MKQYLILEFHLLTPLALHTTGTIVFYKEPEVQAVAYGIWADFQGPDRIDGNLLTWDE